MEDNRYQFTGQEFDEESELYYYNARYYNPVLGRFISRDPVLGRVGNLLTRNGYIYVLNNPLKYVDPSGETTQEVLLEQKLEQEAWKMEVGNSTPNTCFSGQRCDNINPFAVFDYLPISGDFSDVYGFHTGQSLFGGRTLTQEEKDLIPAFAMIPLLTGSQGRLAKEALEKAENLAARGATVAGHFLEGVSQTAMDRLMARLKGLRIGAKTVVEEIEAFGSRTTGWSNRRNAPVNAKSDLDMLLTLPMELNKGRNGRWIQNTLDAIAEDFNKSTGVVPKLHNPELGVDIFKESVFHLDPHAKFIDLFKR